MGQDFLDMQYENELIDYITIQSNYSILSMLAAKLMFQSELIYPWLCCVNAFPLNTPYLSWRYNRDGGRLVIYIALRIRILEMVGGYNPVSVELDLDTYDLISFSPYILGYVLRKIIIHVQKVIVRTQTLANLKKSVK